jgi:hypothetical protein
VRFGREGTSTGFEGEGTRASEVATNFSWNRERERGYSLERRRAPRHALSVKLRGFDAAEPPTVETSSLVNFGHPPLH